ncbi:hypothetical protein T4B_5848, partial [Trichinella pseudospiralis]
LVSDRALCQFTRLSKAWKVWKEWATFMRCRAYAVPCSIIIFHFCAECRKLSSGFGIFDYFYFFLNELLL